MKENRVILCEIYINSLLVKYNNKEIELRDGFYRFLKSVSLNDVSYFDSFL